MRLQNLTLSNFRSYSKQKFQFARDLTLIIGPNTAGKTNILEALFLTAVGKSFRAEKDAEMISQNKETAKVTIEGEKNNEQEKLEIILTRGQFYGHKIASKKYLLNGIPKRMADFTGNLKVSLFWPEDVELVTSSPSTRRRYLDFVLVQIDKQYLESLRTYEKGIRYRNKLLERIREGEAGIGELGYWNEILIKSGAYLTKLRSEFLEFINTYKLKAAEHKFSLFYDSSTISPQRLKQYSKEEIQAGTTLVGPHRDDFRFFIDIKRDLALFGSRGEQRLGILWLKLAELSFIEKKSFGEKPLLLLDDIFSEFDHQNRQLVIKCLDNQQTIITTTDIHLIEEKLQKKAKIINLK